MKAQLINLDKSVPPMTLFSTEGLSLNILRLKLVDLEFNKFLIGDDLAGEYKEKMQRVKTAIVALINAQADKEKMSPSMASLIIKRLLMDCRRESIEAVLSKRYATLDSLRGQQLAYITLKRNLDALYEAQEEIIDLRREVQMTLANEVAQEVVVQFPVTVIKF